MRTMCSALLRRLCRRCPRSGLDHDLQKKMAGKYDPAKAQAVRVWIEAVTKRSLPSDLHEALKSGVVLCELINAIWPGSVKKINQGAMPFVQREVRRAGMGGHNDSACGCSRRKRAAEQRQQQHNRSACRADPVSR